MFDILDKTIIDDVITGIVVVLVLAIGRFAASALIASRDLWRNRYERHLKKKNVTDLHKRVLPAMEDTVGAGLALIGLVIFLGGITGTGVLVIDIIMAVLGSSLIILILVSSMMQQAAKENKR